MYTMVHRYLDESDKNAVRVRLVSKLHIEKSHSCRSTAHLGCEVSGEAQPFVSHDARQDYSQL